MARHALAIVLGSALDASRPLFESPSPRPKRKSRQVRRKSGEKCAHL